MDGQLGSPLGLSGELPLLPSFVSGERERLDLWDEQREGAVRGMTGKESGYVL